LSGDYEPENRTAFFAELVVFEIEGDLSDQDIQGLVGEQAGRYCDREMRPYVSFYFQEEA
jgi:hypothetical protein